MKQKISDLDQEEFDLEVDETKKESKKRKVYVTQKRVELENLLTAAKGYTFQYKPKGIDLKKDVKDLQELTKGSCIYPNRYLNNDDSCVKCDLYENCACVLKNLGKKKRNE
jgi:hypothetical protein